MSRQRTKSRSTSHLAGRGIVPAFGLAFALVLGTGALPACAQDVVPAATEPAPPAEPVPDDAELARRVMGASSPTSLLRRCSRPDRAGDIVVCASDPRRNRIKSDTDLGLATDDGTLRPPDLAPRRDGVTVARGCFVPPCPPPPVYMIDLGAIPETPKGSDAERVANGEIRDR